MTEPKKPAAVELHEEDLDNVTGGENVQLNFGKVKVIDSRTSDSRYIGETEKNLTTDGIVGKITDTGL